MTNGHAYKFVLRHLARARSSTDRLVPTTFDDPIPTDEAAFAKVRAELIGSIEAAISLAEDVGRLRMVDDRDDVLLATQKCINDAAEALSKLSLMCSKMEH